MALLQRELLLRRKRRSLIIVAIVLVAMIALAWSSQTGSTAGSRNQDAPIHLAKQPAKAAAFPTSQGDFSGHHKPSNQDDSDACFAKFPWIEPALEQFYAVAREASAESLQSSEEALDAMGNITWVDGYHPGHDIITLSYDSELQRYTATPFARFPANQPHKSRCIRMPLASAIEAHGGALAKKFKNKEMKLALVTEDFALNWRGSKSKLPAFTLATDKNHLDIPVPDFTYGCYPETHYSNSSWAAVAALLHEKSEMIPWQERSSTVFHRSNWGVGPRKGLMPLLQQLHENGSDVEVLGGQLDIGDTGFTVSNRENFVWLDEQCRHKVAIHTAGFSYSAGLKYKLACGSLVLHFDSDFIEFYQPALVDGVHVVRLPATGEGVDETDFFDNSVPKIKEAVAEAMRIDRKDQPEIAKRGQEFVMTQLNKEALDCYWYGALLRYGDMYFQETPSQKMARERKGGKKGKRKREEKD